MLKSLVLAAAVLVSITAASAAEKAAIGVPDGLKIHKANRAPEADGVRWCSAKGGTVQVDLSTCKVRTDDGGGRSCSAGCFKDGKRLNATTVAAGAGS